MGLVRGWWGTTKEGVMTNRANANCVIFCAFPTHNLHLPSIPQRWALPMVSKRYQNDDKNDRVPSDGRTKWIQELADWNHNMILCNNFVQVINTIIYLNKVFFLFFLDTITENYCAKSVILFIIVPIIVPICDNSVFCANCANNCANYWK